MKALWTWSPLLHAEHCCAAAPGAAAPAGLAWGFFTPSSDSNPPASSHTPSQRVHTSRAQALVSTRASREPQPGQDTGSLRHMAHVA
jgi:hypothetical protein